MLSYFDSITVPGLEHITVFRDDEDATQFYALPGTPRLARDDAQRLLLDLIIYARDVDRLPPEDLEAQRGWLAASVELALTEEEHQKILQHLREVLKNERTGWFLRFFNLQLGDREPKLTLPPQFVDGKVTLDVPTVGGSTALATSKPSLISTNVSTISGNLSQDSSELIRQTVLKGGLPLVANYELTFLARIPSIKVTMEGTRTAFLEESVNRYKTTGVTWHYGTWGWWWGWYWWCWNWAETYPKTNTTIKSHQEETKSISIKIDTSDFRDDPASVAAVAEFEKMAIKIFAENLVPSILKDVSTQFDELKKKLDTASGGGEGEQDPNKELPFGLSDLTADVSDTINITMERSSVIRVTKNPNGTLAKDLTPENIKKAITYLDLSDPYFRELPVRVRANVNFQRDPVYGLKVFLDYDQTDDRIPRAVKGSKTMLFTTADEVKSFRQILARGADGRVKDTYSYWSEIIYKDTGQTIRVPSSGSLTSRETELVISYRSLGFIQVALELSPMPEHVSSVDVTLRYPGSTLPSATQKLTLTREKPTASFFSYTGHDGDPDPYRYQVTYVLTDGQRVDLPEREERAERLAISSPFENTVSTTFVAQGDFTIVDKLIIDAKYVDQPNDLTLDHHAELTSNGASSAWPTSLRNPAKLDFTYTTLVLYKNGSSQRLGPSPDLLGGSVTVGTGGAAALEVLLVPNLDAAHPVAIVQLAYDDEANGVHQTQNYRLDNGQTSQTFKVLLHDPTKRSYRYRIQLLSTPTAPAWDSGWQDSGDTALIVQGPAVTPPVPPTPAMPPVTPPVTPSPTG